MKVERTGGLTGSENMPVSNDVTIGIKTDGTIFQWNNVAEKIFEYAAIEVVGQNISILFSKKAFEKEEAFLGEVKKGNTAQYELACKTKSGRSVFISFCAFAITDKKGNVIGVSKIVNDVSAQKEAEEKQATLASIVSSSDDAIISKTLNGIITSWNEAATKLFGYSAEEAIGSHISLIIPKDSLAEEDLIIENIRKGEKIDHYETVRVAKDGTEKFISLTVSPIKNKKGEVIGASKVARDISYKDSEEEKRAMLAAIVSSSDDAIISKNLQGIITSWNQSAQRMFGYTEEEAIGKHISLIIPKERISEETKIIESIRRGEKIDHFETERVAKDGGRRYISLTVSPIKNRRGKVIGASKVARDISLRLEAEKQRDLYTRRLQELNRYKDEFMVMASHELKTPLTIIMANLQVLHQMMEKHENAVFVQKAFKQVEKLSELVGNLLDVSKIQAGKLALNPSQFDLTQLLTDVIESLQQTTKDHTIVFRNPKKKLMITADRERIEQVVINIISNAIKYSRQSGKITVEAFKKQKTIGVRIADEGIGIPQKDIENVFLRFYRVSGSASSFSGSGVGLYISAEIIKNHGGKIWAESKVGKGSVFHFSLPATNA